MYAAHTDEIGFIVKKIEADGRLRVANMGWNWAGSAYNARVRFRNGISGVVGCMGSIEDAKNDVGKLYIDIGAVSKEDALKYVKLGDVCGYYGEYLELVNDRICAKTLDNRIGCYQLLMALKENDGSYPGDPCASTQHKHHRGYLDSQWKQWEVIRDFYRWCREQGIYLNVPDWYFLNGSNKTPMGYVETNWSLPRAYQEIIERQNIYDGTWQKTPTMGFMFVPLTQYHGGGEAATIEPLCEHLEHYQIRLQNLFGAGVQACFRGPRLYDTEDTRKMVSHWVAFYKKYRRILDSDIVHLRRPDGRDWDGILHVNPDIQQKGFLAVYNPLLTDIERTIRVPLYYTGLHDKVRVKEQDGKARTYTVDRDYSISLKIRIPAKGFNWYIFE